MTQEVKDILKSLQINLSLSGISSYDYREYWADSFIRIQTILDKIDKELKD